VEDTKPISPNGSLPWEQLNILCPKVLFMAFTRGQEDKDVAFVYLYSSTLKPSYPAMTNLGEWQKMKRAAMATSTRDFLASSFFNSLERDPAA